MAVLRVHDRSASAARPAIVAVSPPSLAVMRLHTLLQSLAGLGMAVAACTAFAGASDDAERHIRAIAAHDIDTLMAGYADGATMLWVGGPLDGTYNGPAQLRELWAKFAKAQGPLEVAIAQVQENGNPKGATVVANARYRGANQTKVRQVVVFRDGKILSEVWQIDPAMPFQN
jgi:ketosteroid isomerase-like protein